MLTGPWEAAASQGDGTVTVTVLTRSKGSLRTITEHAPSEPEAQWPGQPQCARRATRRGGLRLGLALSPCQCPNFPAPSSGVKGQVRLGA